MSTCRCLIVFLLFLFLVQTPAGLRAQKTVERLPINEKDIEASLGTEWFGLYLNGKKIGYFSTTRERLGKEPGGTVRDSFTMHMKIATMGLKAEMNLKESREFEGKAPYAFLGGKSVMADGRVTQTTTVVRMGKELEALIVVGNEKKEKKTPAVDYTLADSLLSEVWLRRGPKVGDVVRYQEFDLKDLKLEMTTSKILAIKNSLVNGVPIKYFEVETEVMDGTQVVSLHDAEGKVLSGKFAIFELRAEPEEQAKNTEYSQDLFVLGQAKLDRPLGDLTKVKSLVLEVKSKEAAVLESGPRQAVTKKPGDTLVIKLGKAHGQDAKATKKEIEEALKETDDYPIQHAKIQALAKKAVGNAKTPEEKVEHLVRFVDNYIQPARSATIPNIFDLVKRKRGDCKSYALLFTTLARAAGIPAREVTGLMYIGDDQKALGGHAWNEVVLNGRWVPVDASLGETEINATHLSFGKDAQRHVLNTLGKLSFRVVEVEREK